MKKQLALGAMILFAAVGMARADGPDPIAVRQAGLDLLAGDFAGINAVVAAKGDIKKLEAPAKAIQRWAGVMPSLFPKGSETGGNTKALPEIWSDNDGFKKAAANLAEQAGKLVELVKVGDVDPVAAQVKEVGAACGGCHKTYRAK